MGKFSGHISDVDLHLLRVFRTVAEVEGISSAEAVLGVGRSTISRQITDLETRLGIVLCERGRSGFRLTREGRAILDQLEDLFNSVEDFRRHVSELQDNLTGELKLAITDSFVGQGSNPLPRALQEYSRQAPNVRLRLMKITPNSMERELGRRRCHIGLKPVYTELSGRHYEHLYIERNRLYCSAGHPLAKLSRQNPIGRDIIRQHRFASLSYKSGYAKILWELAVVPSAHANDLEGMVCLILSGNFLGFLPENFAQHFVASGALCRVDSPDTHYSVPFKAVLLEHEEKSLVSRLFLNCLRNAYSAQQ